MKRSNRLVLLVGVFLAIVAFVGILLLVRQPKHRREQHTSAADDGPSGRRLVDIPLSTMISRRPGDDQDVSI